MAATADLRVVCRKLVSTPADDLLRVCPSLVHHVLRAGRPLSAPAETRPKDNANEAAMLAHKLKTHITTLLNGKTPASRFAGMVLVKAVVDVGGWECLRTAEPWVRGLLSMLQKPDPMSSKELCVVTLARIYTLLHEFPTLVREIATPTLPTFATSCLQLLKTSSSGKSAKAPPAFVETAISALATVVPLFPTTLRPFNGQIRAVIRTYLAPTLSDPAAVPYSLRQCSRGLAAVLHYTAPKNAHAEEWANLVAGWLKDSHTTADLVFRAVQESWEPPSGHVTRSVSVQGEPRGGGKLADELPIWTGLDAGAQRLLGLLEALSDCLCATTKSPVSLPVAALTGLVSRILLVVAPPPGANERDLAMQLNPSIGREERDELWSALPDLHVAALQLLHSLVRRLGKNALPLASDMLDQAVRVLASYPQLPAVRQTVFTLTRDLLPICGPTLPKIIVESLAPVLENCCHDLLIASGFVQDDGASENQPKANGLKNGSQGNADLFLPNIESTPLSGAAAQRLRQASAPDADRMDAAEALLEAALSYLPQRHLRKAERALLDRTAILYRSKGAMLAGILNPYVDKSGRAFASTFPFLARQYPGDAGIEILRTNLRTKPHHFGGVFIDGTGADMDVANGEDGQAGSRVSVLTPFRPQQPDVADAAADSAASASGHGLAAAGGFAQYFKNTSMEVDSNPSSDEQRRASQTGDKPADPDEAPFVPLVLKRKSEDDELALPAKRQDMGKENAVRAASSSPMPRDNAAAGDSSDSDDESVHLEMVLEDDDGDDDDDDDDEDGERDE